MNIEEILVKKLINKKQMISFAESITGGMLASTVINVSGSSNIIHESYVTYANETKAKVLGVKPETIEKYSVVSEEVVTEMVNGLYNLTNSNICVSVSGYAETDIKNQGYAWYAILINNDKKNNYLFTKETFVKGSRNKVRRKITDEILECINLIIGE